MSDLYRLVYASKNLLCASESDMARAVLQILRTSQRNNAAVGVSGALLFNMGAFAQVLEGPRPAVEDTFERIQRDSRHGDVTVLQCGSVDSRGFADWSMAFVGQSPRGQALWNDLASSSGFDITRLEGDAVFSMLHGLVREEEGYCATRSDAVMPDTAAELVPALKVEQVRREMAELRPDLASLLAADGVPAPSPATSQPGQTLQLIEAALATVRTSTADLHQRTMALRRELDESHAAQAAQREQIAGLRRERDMWAERARVLAIAIGDEASACTSPAPATRSVEAA